MPAWGSGCGGPVPSNAAVMRRFTRVVALPDPKNSDFLSRINTFRTAGLQDTWRGVGMTSAETHAVAPPLRVQL